MRTHGMWIMTAGLSLLSWTTVPCIASTRQVDRGAWPGDWPEELGPCRASATTTIIVGRDQENVYSIKFKTREEFERLWPVLLRVKTKNGTLTLHPRGKERGPASRPSDVAAPSVRILAPVFSPPPGEEADTIQPVLPWEDTVLLPDGGLPEHVTENAARNGWIAWNDQVTTPYRMRARTDFELFVDGEIVDLNRIGLPADTPIIDRRGLLPATRPATIGDSRAQNLAGPDDDKATRWAKRIARKVVPGLRRAQVEKVLRYRDDGDWGDGWSAYYENSEVMIFVKYDDAGGRGNRENRVTKVEFRHARPHNPNPPPIGHKERWAEVNRIASGIALGTKRSEVEKLFPHKDGGLQGPGTSRYYAGDEVMADVDYDRTGGDWNSQNRVVAPIRVYRDREHED